LRAFLDGIKATQGDDNSALKSTNKSDDNSSISPPRTKFTPQASDLKTLHNRIIGLERKINEDND
jgi:hypothetical protein